MCKHIHYDVIVAWAGGALIQWRPDNNKGGEASWSDVSAQPLWTVGNQYRVKPKPKVKKWKWVYKDDSGNFVVSYSHQTETDAVKHGWLQQVDASMIEVEDV